MAHAPQNSSGNRAKDFGEDCEEFALLLPDSTGAAAQEMADRLPAASAQQLLVAADEALYRAKREGRNRTVVARLVSDDADHPEPGGYAGNV